jgi:hypothetical protein
VRLLSECGCGSIFMSARAQFLQTNRRMLNTRVSRTATLWMDLGFSLPGKSNDTYPQHHEKVSILAEDNLVLEHR